MTNKLKIGHHVSKNGRSLIQSLKESYERLIEILPGSICVFQIFVSGPRSFKIHKILPEEIQEIKEFLNDSGTILVVHGTYLDRPFDGRKEAIKSIQDQREMIKSMSPKKGNVIGPIIHMSKISRRTDPDDFGVKGIILENDATKDMSSIQELFEETSRWSFPVILDTAHTFESGIDLADPRVMHSFLRELPDNVIGFHLNDSSTPLGSAHDRHAPIGQGHIFAKKGKVALKEILLWARRNDLFMIIESPDEDIQDSLEYIKAVLD